MFIFLYYRQCQGKLLKACMVDIDFNRTFNPAAMRLEFDIYLCPLDTYCKPFGDTGPSALFGYVR